MLDNLTNRFYTVFRNIRGQARLDEENIKPALREVRLALLEADVALPVVKDFVADLKAKAVGQEISENLTAEQAFISIVNQALIDLMGKQNSALNLTLPHMCLVIKQCKYMLSGLARQYHHAPVLVGLHQCDNAFKCHALTDSLILKGLVIGAHRRFQARVLILHEPAPQFCV